MNSYGVADWLGYLSHKEIETLQELARMLPPHPIVVNVGAGGGTSGLAFLEARPDLILYSIDIQEESSPLGCLEGERNAIEASGVAWQGRFFQIHGDSKEVGQNWHDKVDLVFIDGDHTPEGCRGDIEAWLPHVRRGGVLALHDYGKRADDKPHPGVDQAVDELLMDYYPLLRGVDTLVAFQIGA